MNYYKLKFNKEYTGAYQMFFVAVTTRYGADLWGPCETSFILFATADDAEKVMEMVDVSKDKWASGFQGADNMQLLLSTASVDDPELPDEARQWLIKTISAVASLRELLDNFESSARK